MTQRSTAAASNGHNTQDTVIFGGNGRVDVCEAVQMDARGAVKVLFLYLGVHSVRYR